MKFRESETVELKREYVEDIRKEIIAMANSDGGVIYIGVADDGTVMGVEQPDPVICQVTNAARDAILPDVTMFLRCQILDCDGLQVVEIRVQRGASRPYYLRGKGIRPEGVFVRQGTSCVPATGDAIRRMIKETDGDNYEDMRSLRQELTFSQAKGAFAQQHLELGEPQMKTLGMMDTDGIFTNLGLLLSDQCPHILKAATFGGVDQQDFQDRREFGGSLLKQLDDAYSYLDLRNRTHASFDGLRRIDSKDYPDVAIREALLNAMIHRDYAFSAGTLVSVYQDRIEMVSIGGLVHGVMLEDVMMGLSVCRNQKLASIFYRLDLIEAYGTGIRKIQSAYAQSNQKPSFFATNNAFKLVLPNLTSAAPAPITPKPLSDEETIVFLLKKSGAVTRKDVENALQCKTSTANRLLQRLCETGILAKTGKGKNTKYIIG